MINRFTLTLEQNLFLAKELLIESIYSSAKLEGLELTYEEVKSILTGVNIPNMRLDEINCALNLRDA